MSTTRPRHVHDTSATGAPHGGSKFCTNCGAKLPPLTNGVAAAADAAARALSGADAAAPPSEPLDIGWGAFGRWTVRNRAGVMAAAAVLAFVVRRRSLAGAPRKKTDGAASGLAS